ncbi:MAG: TraR/DksA family transcriptional regulator [Acidimicrobiia bacterium]|nr:TraR/DksA family transcriptional regulator [Acidimicrobiia bacterium]
MTMPSPKHPIPEASTEELRSELMESLEYHKGRLAAAASQDDEISHAMLNRSERTVEQIEAALERIEIGEYGLCDTCGDWIGIDRLNALPHASDCTVCASAPTRNQRFAR